MTGRFKKLMATGMAVALAAAMALASAAPALAVSKEAMDKTANDYYDIPADHWAKTSGVIDYAIGRGLITGYDNGAWGPNDYLTRGQLSCILVRAICEPGDWDDDINRNDGPFDNASGYVCNTFYLEPMTYCYLTGLIQGNGWIDRYAEDGTYRGSEPNVRGEDNITREELAVMLARAERLKGSGSTDADLSVLDSMPDGWKVSEWARADVAWAIEEGIISGKPGVGIDPQGNATRAEAAKMIMIMLKGKGFDPTEHAKTWVEPEFEYRLPTITCSYCGMWAYGEDADYITHAQYCVSHTGGMYWLAYGQAPETGTYTYSSIKEIAPGFLFSFEYTCNLYSMLPYYYDWL